ncbi:MAG: M23 family metallopeptidase, partial [Anaerolineae bacterium]
PSPTNTNTPIPTPTATSTPTAVPTATPTQTPTAVPISSCPPFPTKPDYARYVLGASWPSPNPDLSFDHFWLAKPLPGGGRFLTNLNYPYGYDGGGSYLLHNGVDAAEKLGTPVLAAASGTVILARSDVNELQGWRCDWYHNLVVIQLDETWAGRPLFILYGHVLNVNVEEGQRVQAGEPVAEVGIGGAAVVPHLHTEVRWGENTFGSTVNPYLWISPGSTRGVIAGRLVDENGRPWQGVGLSIAGVSENTNELLNTWTYLADPAGRVTVQPDPGWAENFVFADLKPGEYVIYTKVRDIEYRVPITVTAGRVTPVEIMAKDEG